MKIREVTITVRHLDGAAAFYRDVLRMPVDEQRDRVAVTVGSSRLILVPAEPTLACGQPMALDPSRGPKGAWQLWIQVLDVPGTPTGDAAGTLDVAGGWTAELRERFAERVHELLRIYLPDLDGCVLERVAFSPADIETENMNLIGGGPSAGARDIDQTLLWRPSAMLPSPRTPVDRLFHIGASTHPAGGLSGGSGYLLARRLLRHRGFGRR